VKKILVFIVIVVLIYFVFSLTRRQQPGPLEPSKLGSDKTDIFAIPLDTSPTEERINREQLEELEEELQEEN
jgi:hypothetical protein